MKEPQLSKLLNFAEIEKQSDILKFFLEKGGTLQEILQLPKKNFNDLYVSGFQLHQQQQYGKSKKIFALLTLFSPDIPKFWWALGASQVALDLHQEALTTYSVLMILEPENPQPHFFAAFCHQRLGDNKQAVEAFQRGSLLRSHKEKQ